MNPSLHLSIQYTSPCPELPRWKLRRWIQASLSFLELPDDYQSIVLTLRLVDANEARILNKQYRNKDYATNILTFEYGLDPSGNLCADLVICVDVLRNEAIEQKKTFIDHAAHLCIHGTLHALGYDHINPEEAEEMESLERDILKKFAIADPYQVC